MYIGEQISKPTDDRLRLSTQLGVKNVVIDVRPNDVYYGPDGKATVDKVREYKNWVEGFGLKVDCMALNTGSFLLDTLYNEERAGARAETMRTTIRAMARAGIPMVKYNVQMVGITRTAPTPGRGGVLEPSFRLAEHSAETNEKHSYWGNAFPAFDRRRPGPIENKLGAPSSNGQIPAHSVKGGVSESQAWAAIDRLVEEILPTAEECGIRLAAHPQDPAYPKGGLDGVEHVLGSIEGMERMLDIAPESPCHGTNFCQGTIAEMSRDPGSYVLDAIRRIGARGKIFMVHFRNIKGGFCNFSECFPDEGDVDMHASIQAYREVGYGGILCPDHVPMSDLDPNRERFFAFALGFTKGLLQAA